MFGLTDDAATLVRSLTRTSASEPGTGIRMSIDPARGSLAMSLAPGPDTADTVIIRHDVRVFIAPTAAARLRSATLDAELETHPAFFLRER